VKPKPRHERDGMLEEYNASMQLGARIDAENRYSGRAGYVRHAQNTTWWERILGVIGTAALLFFLVHWLLVRIGLL
jgi:hypothetical protein